VTRQKVAKEPPASCNWKETLTDWQQWPIRGKENERDREKANRMGIQHRLLTQLPIVRILNIQILLKFIWLPAGPYYVFTIYYLVNCAPSLVTLLYESEKSCSFCCNSLFCLHSLIANTLRLRREMFAIKQATAGEFRPQWQSAQLSGGINRS
jgi:hypothetical protein